MTDNYQKTVKLLSGAQGVYSKPDIRYTYSVQTGEVIVGFDFSVGWSVNSINAIYTVPFDSLTSTPKRNVISPPFMGNEDKLNNNGVPAGDNQHTSLVPSGCYITSFSTNQNSNPISDLTDIIFTYYDPTKKTYGTMRTGSSPPADSWDVKKSVNYASSNPTDAIIGFECYGSRYLGGFTQVTFCDYAGMPFFVKAWVFHKLLLIVLVSLLLLLIIVMMFMLIA